ncbi:glycosyltransferase family 4 protein [Bacillus vallismortis]|uniref:glycosyltransferase family 4 protein n=2 Tax=Bacillus vallismortis TaxID=72361 RepID=UPI00227EFCE8|nr:glycosyltransferase family 4 protein [Bacillus vallismortis]MCY8307434.1 glycosyltransferase family 4 protein [Bacillus vallismortis]
MKITFLVYNIYGMGGTVRTVANTANYLAAQNYDVEIISVRRTRGKPMFDLDKRIKLTPIFDARRGKLFGKNTPLYKKIIKRILMKMPSVFIDKNEDLYHMFNLFVDLKILKKLSEINQGVLITTIPSFNFLSAKFVNRNVIKIGQEHKFFGGYERSIQTKIRRYYKKLDALTCLTDAEINDYKRLLNNNTTDLYKIENATHMPKESSNLVEKTVIAAGRFVHEKGFDQLIDAFEKVSQEYPEWRLKIFGDGVEKDSLRQMIFDKKLYNNVFLMPKTDNIIKEMANSSIYALSSRNESFGMVIIEAMSVGVPCVSYSCIGPAEIIKDGEDGLLVERNDVDKLAESLTTLIKDESLRKTMGRNAKENVKRYSFEVVGSKWENLLHEQEFKKNKTSLKKIYSQIEVQ